MMMNSGLVPMAVMQGFPSMMMQGSATSATQFPPEAQKLLMEAHANGEVLRSRPKNVMSENRSIHACTAV